MFLALPRDDDVPPATQSTTFRRFVFCVWLLFAECIVAYISLVQLLTEGAACSSLSAKTASTVAVIYGGDTKP